VLAVQQQHVLTPMLGHHMTRQTMRPHGFSLIETMVALTILGLLMLAAAPSIGTWMDNTRIRNGSDAIQTGLQIARNTAIGRNTSVTFWLVSANATDSSKLDNNCSTLLDSDGSWVVSINDPTGQCAASPSVSEAPRLVDKRAIGDAGGGVTVSAVHVDAASNAETTADHVTFNGFGRVSNDDAITRITLASRTNSSARNLRLDISSTGQIRVCDPAVTASDDPRLCAE